MTSIDLNTLRAPSKTSKFIFANAELLSRCLSTANDDEVTRILSSIANSTDKCADLLQHCGSLQSQCHFMQIAHEQQPEKLNLSASQNNNVVTVPQLEVHTEPNNNTPPNEDKQGTHWSFAAGDISDEPPLFMQVGYSNAGSNQNNNGQQQQNASDSGSSAQSPFTEPQYTIDGGDGDGSAIAILGGFAFAAFMFFSFF